MFSVTETPQHGTIGLMKKLDFIYFDAGGGHRAAANALRQVMERQERPCEIRMVNLQELTRAAGRCDCLPSPSGVIQIHYRP